MRLPVPRNVGATDRLARVVLGVGVAVAPVALGAATGITAALAILGASTAMSGVLGRCSIYHLVGIDTRGVPSE